MLWQKQRNILAFPYGWQHPAKTEEWAYQRCLLDLPESYFIEIICFPWATLIDLLRKGQQSKAQVYLDALQSASPRKTLIRATICQHIYMKDLLPFFYQLKITDIFWSHAIKGETQLQGVRIHAFPLYPVRCAELDNKPLKPLHERRYLYSFVGAYDPKLYLTPIRQWLSDLPFSSNGALNPLARGWCSEKDGEIESALELSRYKIGKTIHFVTSIVLSNTGGNSAHPNERE